jgi:hypothetical protein
MTGGQLSTVIRPRMISRDPMTANPITAIW